jgi:general secretion pathway protein G
MMWVRLPLQSWPEEPVACGSLGEKERRQGITLIELVFIVMIIVTIAAIGFPAYTRYRDNARLVQAISDLRTMEHDILIQEAYSGTLPTSLADIGKDTLRDPWGYPYQYLNIRLAKTADVRKDQHLNPLNTDFDLYSVGADGQTKPQINYQTSLDDVIRALNGAYIGLASEF